MPKWSPWVLLGLILVLIFGPQLLPGPDREKLGFEEFRGVLRAICLTIAATVNTLSNSVFDS